MEKTCTTISLIDHILENFLKLKIKLRQSSSLHSVIRAHCLHIHTQCSDYWLHSLNSKWNWILPNYWMLSTNAVNPHSFVLSITLSWWTWNWFQIKIVRFQKPTDTLWLGHLPTHIVLYVIVIPFSALVLAYFNMLFTHVI